MSEVWNYIINRYTLGLKVAQPEWFNWPAAMRLTLTSWETLHTFDKFNEDKSYGESVKPWNFAISYSLAPVARMLNPNMRLVAPFYTDLSQWRNVPVYDIHADNPVRLRITTSSREWTDGPLWGEIVDDDVIQVQSYADIVREYVNHPEAKYDDADGNPCTGTTRGRLYPTKVTAECYEHIGKTGHQRLSADTTLVKNSGYYRQYANDAESRILDTTRVILNEDYTRDALLLELRYRGIEAARSTIGNFKKGVGKPQAPLADALISIAKEIARKQLESAGLPVKRRITDGQIFSKWRLAKENGWIENRSQNVIGVVARWD